MSNKSTDYGDWEKRFAELWKEGKIDEALALRKEVWDTWLKEGDYAPLPPEEQEKWEDRKVCLPDGTIADDPTIDQEELWKRRLERMYADLRTPAKKPGKLVNLGHMLLPSPMELIDRRHRSGRCLHLLNCDAV